MAKRLYIEDELINLLVKHFNLHWVSDFVDYLADEKGEEFSVDDYEYLEIPTTIVEWEKGGTKMHCDGILFFGDGCTEFHDADTCEAFNWCEFTDESVEKITDIVRNIVRDSQA